MAKLVRVKVTDSGAIKTMTETAALRLTTTNPKMYTLIEPQVVESISLPPLPQKKSVEVAAEDKPVNKEEPKSIGQNIPSNEKKAQPVTTKQTTEQALFKK